MSNAFGVDVSSQCFSCTSWVSFGNSRNDTKEGFTKSTIRILWKLITPCALPSAPQVGTGKQPTPSGP